MLVLVLELGGFTFTVRLIRLVLRRETTVDPYEPERLELERRLNNVDLVGLNPDRDFDLNVPLVFLEVRFNDVDLLDLNADLGVNVDIPLKLLILELFVDLFEVTPEDVIRVDFRRPREDGLLVEILVLLESETRLDREDNEDDLERPEACFELALLDAPIEVDAAIKTQTTEIHNMLRI